MESTICLITGYHGYPLIITGGGFVNTNMARAIYQAAARLRSENTFEYLKEYQRTQWLSPNDLRQYQHSHLESLLAYAREYIPFYHFAKKLIDCPVITREMIKKNPGQFKSTLSSGRTTAKSTSGSTSEPITVYKDEEAMAREQAITFRSYGWAGVRPGMRQIRFWGVALKNHGGAGIWIKDVLLNRIRLSAFSYTPEVLHNYARRIKRAGRCYFYGYASAIFEFALFAKAHGYTFKNVQAIITTAELLTPHRREVIEESLQVPVFDEYGCAEVGTIGHQDDCGTMFINAENMIVEVLGDDGKISPEGEGTLLVTELHNRLQPLIRYNLGDIGIVRLYKQGSARGLPVLEKVHGRVRDVLVGPNGKRYNSAFISYIFKDVQKHGEHIRQYQAVQDGQRLIFRIVKGNGYRQEMERHIAKLVSDEFGGYFECAFEYPSSIQRDRSGKMRQLIRMGIPDQGSDTAMS